MVKVSKNRTDLENGRLEQAHFKDYSETVSTVASSSGALTLNIANGNVFSLLQTEDITSITVSNPSSAGKATAITLIRQKDDTGTARAITWPSSFYWPNGTAPTLTQTALATDIITAVTRDGGLIWHASAVTAAAKLSLSALFTWGSNASGQLGQGDTVDRSSPTQVGALGDWSIVAKGGRYHIGAIKTNGTLWMWGQNESGQVGDSSTANRSSPVQIGTFTDWTHISLGFSHSLARRSGGTIWTWGEGTGGLLGQVSNTTDRSSPVQIGTLAIWSDVSAGRLHNLALRTDSTLWAWGDGAYGKLGQVSTNASRSSPVQITGTTWTKIAAARYHNAAIRSDNTLWAWGYGAAGRLGQVSTNANRSSPVQIAGTDWESVVSGAANHTHAIRTTGTLWGWGQNATNGRIGDGSVANRSSPVQIGTLATWATATNAASHSGAMKDDGTIWRWGDNSAGQVGDGTITDRSSPVQIGTLATWTSQGITGPSGGIATVAV